MLSSFQLARGYSPSILGMPSQEVSQELLDAHVETVAIRAVQKVMRSKVSCVQPRTSFKAGMKAWVSYKTSKQNERPRCVEARVVEAKEHVLKYHRRKKGLPMDVAYEPVRIAPQGELTRELLQSSLEDELMSITEMGRDDDTKQNEDDDTEQNHDDEKRNKRVNDDMPMENDELKSDMVDEERGERENHLPRCRDRSSTTLLREIL